MAKFDMDTKDKAILYPYEEEFGEKFPKLFSTKEEVRSLMFMNDIRKESWGRRPLAKLTHDIYVEIRRWKMPE